MTVENMGIKYTALLLGIILMMATFVFVQNTVYAQGSQTTTEPFVVVIAVQGIDSSTGYIMNWVTANNVTIPLLLNVSTVDAQDDAKDGIVEAPITFPNSTVSAGDKFSACIVVLKKEDLMCDTGFDSPSGRAEFVSFLLPQS